PAVSAAPAGRAGRPAARVRRPAGGRFRVRSRRLPAGDRPRRRADPPDPGPGGPGRGPAAVSPQARHDRSLSFGSQAAAYERGRPSYPPEAIDWLLPPDGRDVLDLGAGTGKLTARL